MANQAGGAVQDGDVARHDAEQPDAEQTTPPRRGWSLSTGEFPIVPRIDLSAAYAAVRARARSLRRRRIISSVVAAAVFASLLTVIGAYYVSTIPLPDALGLPATTTVYYSDATTVLARLGVQNRIIVDPATLPWHLSAAVVAAEDPGFWNDSATLISRHYARAATDVDVTSTVGKARLLVMSWRLEDQYHKREILGFYLNTVYFGRGAYGVEAAARAYFGTSAARLTMAESIVLAGVIEAPGDGRFDPSVDLMSARARFASITERMVSLGSLDRSTARRLRVPAVRAFDPLMFQSGMDRPTGLVVSQVLAELYRAPAFRDKPGGYLENGGLSIVTTIDVRAQRLLERLADETEPASLLHAQPDNVQAAAVVVEPGTGRVLGYYGGSDGTGADYAGWYTSRAGLRLGYGAHPPGQSFDAYTVAAALRAGISVRSVWHSPPSRGFAGSSRGLDNPVRDALGAPCQPSCDLVEATAAGLRVPMFAVTERISAAAVLDLARAAGIESLWLPESAGQPRRQVSLSGAGGQELPFGSEVALGEYSVTVLDQANAMATFAAGGRRAQAHFVRRVMKDTATVYAEALAPEVRVGVLDRAALADLTWTLRQNPAGALADGRPSAAAAGSAQLRSNAFETAHAWLVGYTGNLAMAVWVGNEETEFPLRDAVGARITGSGLPAEIYRGFMAEAHEELGLPWVDFPAPAFTGDPAAGDSR